MYRVRSQRTVQSLSYTRVLWSKLARVFALLDRLGDRFPFIVAAVALAISLTLPYWEVTLLAPQYPSGLHVALSLTEISGDVHEVDELNHYIGMMPLEEGAPLERAIAPYGVALLVVLALLAASVRRRWTAMLALAIVVFPIAFILDLQYWLWYFGHHLDRTAALSSSIRPFTPPVLGTGRVGQFSIRTHVGPGLWLALVAALSVIVGFRARRQSLKGA